MSLEILVCNFRKAIEAARKNKKPRELFRKFPEGQCAHIRYTDKGTGISSLRIVSSVKCHKYN